MKTRIGPWRLVVITVALCLALVAGFYFWLDARRLTTADLLTYFPTSDTPVVYLDVGALRSVGVVRHFTNPVVYEEPEYRKFVSDTGFDYTQDLDAVLFTTDGTTKFILARGRFHWELLRSYVLNSGGSCHNGVCQMNGSTPDRKISFYSPRSGVLALAVGPARLAAAELRQGASQPAQPVPQSPVWASATVAQLQAMQSLPAGARAFLSALEGARRVQFELGLGTSGLRLRLAAQCADSADAERIRKRLDLLTTTLKSWLSRENQTPSPRDLSGALSTGKFSTSGATAVGEWAIDPALARAMFDDE